MNYQKKTTIFMKMHQTTSGIQKPIVSMTDDHLMNTLRLNLIKKVDRVIEDYRKQVIQERDNILGKFAPPDMSERQRIALGKRLMKPKDQEKLAKLEEDANEYIELIRSSALNQGFENMLPYLIVAASRDSLYQQVHELLVEITGINTTIDLPNDVVYPTMTRQEVLELTGGDVDEADPGHGQGYDEMGNGEFGDDDYGVGKQPRTWGDV
jgi:hypothetical protein